MGLIQRLAIVLGGSLCLVAVLAIWFLLTGSFDATGVRVLGSTAVISLCVVGGLVGVAVLDRPDLRRVLGAATALLATVVASLSLAAIWGVWRLLGVLAVLSTLATLLAPIVRRLERGRSGDAPAGGAPEPTQPQPPAPARKPGHLWLASDL